MNADLSRLLQELAAHHNRNLPFETSHARELAAVAHANQTDKNNQPYIGHPTRVASHAHRRAQKTPDLNTEHAVMAAWLHDVLEDTPVTADDLTTAGVPAAVIEALQLLNHPKHEPYDQYIARLTTNRLATLVKHADLDDNTDPDRMAQLDHNTRQRLTNKYTPARQQLAQAHPDLT